MSNNLLTIFKKKHFISFAKPLGQQRREGKEENGTALYAAAHPIRIRGVHIQPLRLYHHVFNDLLFIFFFTYEQSFLNYNI